MNDDENPEDDFTADEMALIRYIFKQGLYCDKSAAEALGWSIEWVRQVAEQLHEKGVLRTFAGKCRVYKIHLKGGPLDGLVAEMAMAVEEPKIVFTLPAFSQYSEDLLLSDPHREIPSGMNSNDKVTLLLGKILDKHTAAVYTYDLSDESRPDCIGLNAHYSGVIASGTEIQMQALINAQMGRQ